MIAGAGFMQHMIATLKQNKSMLRGKRKFAKDKTFLNAEQSDFKSAQGKLLFKKPTSVEKKLPLLKPLL